MSARRPAYSLQSLQIRSAPTRLSVTLPRLCFQSLPTIKFCNSFPLITIQLYRGCTPLAPQPPRISRVPYVLPSSVCSKSFVSHSYENCRGVYSSHSGTNLGTPHRPEARAERSFELSTVSCQLLARAPRCGRYLSSHCSRHRTVQQCRCTGKQLRSFRCLTRESGHRVRQALGAGTGKRSILDGDVGRPERICSGRSLDRFSPNKVRGLKSTRVGKAGSVRLG